MTVAKPVIPSASEVKLRPLRPIMALY